MKTLNAKTIKTAGQTIIYKGTPLTVSWGGEWYTALHAGNIFRQTILADLKQDIIHGWVYYDFGLEDDVAALTAMQERHLMFKVTGRLVDGKPAMRIDPVRSKTFRSIMGFKAAQDFNNAIVSEDSDGLYIVLCTGHKPSAVIKGRTETLAALRAYVRAAYDMGVKPSVVNGARWDTDINDILRAL